MKILLSSATLGAMRGYWRRPSGCRGAAEVLSAYLRTTSAKTRERPPWCSPQDDRTTPSL